MLNSLWKNDTALMLGIDIGTHSIKAVLLNHSDAGYILENVAIEPMPIGAIVDREIQDIDTVGKVIAKIRKKITSSVQHAASAVSGQTVITKIIYMDIGLTEVEIASQIEIEADNLIPFPLDEVNLDFESLDVNESDPTKINVLLSAARTETIATRVLALEAGGFDTKVIDVESYAINRCYDLILKQLPNDAADKIVATIDIGATIILFSASEAGKHIYSRDLLFDGNLYTRSITSCYHKSFEEIELAKISDNLPANYTTEVLIPFHTLLVQQTRRAIQGFLTSCGKEKIDYLVISGGNALIEGVAQRLTDELNVHTVITNPFNNMELSKKVDQNELAKTAPRFMVAAGLALRSFVPWHI